MKPTLPIPTFLVDRGRFLLRVLNNPRNIGAVAPSSAALARAMAAEIPHGPVLELGPGTGVVTQAILARGLAPSELTLVEYDKGFATLLRNRFPDVRVVRGDAFDLQRTLGVTTPFGAIVSGLPLLNFPPESRANFLMQIFARLAPGAPFIQFSYGLRPSVPAPEGVTVKRAAFVAFNLPPARVWVYRKTQEA
jgi:phosphatidylethanolamine/phosphatidyl-N-methylethanolamine N-methyltransferase